MKDKANLKSGLCKIRNAVILNIIATAAIITGGSTAIINGMRFDANPTLEGAAAAGMIGICILGIGSVLMLISFIVKLIGLTKVADYDDDYRSAFALTIVALIAQVLVAAFSFIPAIRAGGHFVNSFASLVEILTITLICSATRNVLIAEKKEKLAKSAATVRNWVVILVLASVLVRLYVYSAGNFADRTFVGITGCIAGVATIIGYIMYITMLSRAAKAIKK